MSRPPTITAAVALGVSYGAVLIAVAAGALFEFVTGTGAIGDRHLDAQAGKGVVTLGIVLPLGAAMLWRGAANLARDRDPRLLVLPLAGLLIVGCVGETIDVLGTATPTSDLIGAGILILVALPLAMLALPESRTWTAERWSSPQR